MAWWYAVKIGKCPGVYKTWDEAKLQVNGFQGAVHKKFEKRDEAEAFVSGIREIMPRAKDHCAPDTCEEQGLVCFTDGATSRNGATDAPGGFAVVWPHRMELNVSEHVANTTNNRMELSAVIKAIEQANASIDPERKETLIIYTDSVLVINTATKWLNGWKKKGYMKSNGEPVMNRDLVERLDEMLQTRRTIFKYVPAHTGANDWKSKYNAMADELARRAVKS
jgi:ribonuclease HI